MHSSCSEEIVVAHKVRLGSAAGTAGEGGDSCMQHPSQKHAVEMSRTFVEAIPRGSLLMRSCGRMRRKWVCGWRPPLPKRRSSRLEDSTQVCYIQVIIDMAAFFAHAAAGARRGGWRAPGSCGRRESGACGGAGGGGRGAAQEPRHHQASRAGPHLPAVSGNFSSGICIWHSRMAVGVRCRSSRACLPSPLPRRAQSAAICLRPCSQAHQPCQCCNESGVLHDRNVYSFHSFYGCGCCRDQLLTDNKALHAELAEQNEKVAAYESEIIRQVRLANMPLRSAAPDAGHHPKCF